MDIEELTGNAALPGDPEAIRQIAGKEGVILSSTQKLYKARAEGRWSSFTVPAINLRTLTFEAARAVFRQAVKRDIGAFIFELARSEIGYTDQPISEYVSLVLAAALEENFKGRVFCQGDHFQAKADKFFSPEKKEGEISSLKKLIEDSLRAGVYNIDIDSSTLVQLEKETLEEQQLENCRLTANLAHFSRSLEPEGITVSLGGEVGEIGGKNSTPEELRAFVSGFKKEFSKLGGKEGFIKIAVQTGATHGGVVGPEGKIVKADIDFEVIKQLSEEARSLGLAGVVQHGASTLPDEYFHKFPETGAVEIHLATGFQNIILDSEYFPQSLKEKMYDWLKKERAEEKKPDQTEEQFLYKTRKRALGPFKKEILALDKSSKEKISEELEAKFGFLFQKLKVENTRELVNKIYE